MSKIALEPNVAGTGTFSIASPNSNTNRTLTLPDETGTVLTKNVSGVAAVNGVSFPATQSPSTDSNTLDDYEEGTYTPSVVSTVGSITSYTASGVYTKIGRVVHVKVAVSITNNGTGAGSVIVSLPFTSSSDGMSDVGAGRENASVGYMLQWMVNPNSSTGAVFTYANGYPAGTGYSLLLSVTYNV